MISSDDLTTSFNLLHLPFSYKTPASLTDWLQEVNPRSIKRLTKVDKNFFILCVGGCPIASSVLMDKFVNISHIKRNMSASLSSLRL